MGRRGKGRDTQGGIWLRFLSAGWLYPAWRLTGAWRLTDACCSGHGGLLSLRDDGEFNGSEGWLVLKGSGEERKKEKVKRGGGKIGIHTVSSG